MPTPRSSLYRMANERLNGQLASRLSELRGEGRSWADIAVEIALTSDGMRVSQETLRQWARQLGIEETAAA